MKTTLDLPRPLLLRIVSRASKLGMPISRYVAEQLETRIPQPDTLATTQDSIDENDELFNALRDELGL